MNERSHWIAAVAALAAAIMLAAVARGATVERFSGGPVADSEAAGHAVMPATGGPVPERGVTVTRDGLTITRMTDVSISRSKVAQAWTGNPAQGWTNGYSKYSCVNVNGQYAIAYGSAAGMGTVIRLSDLADMGGIITGWDGASTGIGETNGARWDLSGRPGTETRIWLDSAYADLTRAIGGDWLGWFDALSREKALVYRAPGQVVNMDHHAGQSGDYRAFIETSPEGKRLRIANLATSTVLPVVLPAAGHDLSPSGAWLYLDAGRPGKFYRMADLEVGTTEPAAVSPTTSHGHDGWAWLGGREVYVSQDNTNDWFFAFNPSTNERIDIWHMSETGWAINSHFATTPSSLDGWTLWSTYSDADGWAANQLMLIEIAPASARPRILRLGSTENVWLGGQRGDKTGGYFTEAFASVDPQGAAVYWGANWMGSDNLELYRLELPDGWRSVNPGPTPTPLPSPTPEPTPVSTPELTPTPTPTPEPWRIWRIEAEIRVREGK